MTKSSLVDFYINEISEGKFQYELEASIPIIKAAIQAKITELSLPLTMMEVYAALVEKDKEIRLEKLKELGELPPEATVADVPMEQVILDSLV